MIRCLTFYKFQNFFNKWNKIIGYTGEGGNEYWKKPIFTKISNGDFNSFVEEILKFIKNNTSYLKFKNQRIKLLKKYSNKSEIKSLKILIKKIIK